MFSSASIVRIIFSLNHLRKKTTILKDRLKIFFRSKMLYEKINDRNSIKPVADCAITSEHRSSHFDKNKI